MRTLRTLVCLMFILMPTARVLAQSLPPDDANSINNDTVWYKAGLGSGSGSGSCSPTTLTGSDHEQQTWNYFKSQGLSDPQVAGIMGNIWVESRFDPEVMQIGGDSQNPYDAGSLGWGIVQWSGNKGPRSTGDFVTILYKETGATGPVYELSAQLFMVWAEMNHSSPTGVKDMVAGLRQINDPAQAATYFLTNFEGGKDVGQVREKEAVIMLAKYGGTGQSGGGGSDCGPSASGSCKVVYNAEYSQQQLAQIFGNPGTADSHPDLHLQSVSFMGFSVQVSPLIAPCLQSVEQQIKAANINYTVNAVGCYRFDSNNGVSNIGLSSYHTYGAACDINPATNPFQLCPGCNGPYDMPKEYVTIFRNNGFTWGGDWTTRKDYMHFEWHGVIPK